MYPKGGGADVTYFFLLFIHSFTSILITVPLYRRKFCDGHIILVFFSFHLLKNQICYRIKQQKQEKTQLGVHYCCFIALLFWR